MFGSIPMTSTVTHRHRSYANVAAVLWAETGEAGTYEFLRLVFSVLIGNADTAGDSALPPPLSGLKNPERRRTDMTDVTSMH